MKKIGLGVLFILAIFTTACVTPYQTCSLVEDLCEKRCLPDQLDRELHRSHIDDPSKKHNAIIYCMKDCKENSKDCLYYYYGNRRTNK